MKFICEKAILSEVVNNVSRAVSAKSTLSALEGILIKAKNGEISLYGYDLDMGIFASLPASIKEEGEIVLTARLFGDIIRKMAGETVCLEVNERRMVTITSANSEFSILGIPADEFPEMPSVANGEIIEISQPVLKSMIDQTIFAAATNDAKPVHTGALFEAEGGYANLVAVDGFRLAMRREKISFSENLKFVVPGKTLSEVSKLLSGDGEDIVKINVTNKHITFSISGYSVVSRLLEGEFLDYKAAIPVSNPTVVTVNTRECIEAIERTSLLISDRLKSPLKVTIDGGMVRMSCVTPMGRAHDEIPCDMKGEKIEIGFNNRYLLDALKASWCDSVRLMLNGPLSPMKVCPPDGDSFLFLVLPVRLKND